MGKATVWRYDIVKDGQGSMIRLCDEETSKYGRMRVILPAGAEKQLMQGKHIETNSESLSTSDSGKSVVTTTIYAPRSYAF